MNPLQPVAPPLAAFQDGPAWSIVSTMYRSAPFLETFVRECIQALRAIGATSFEIVLVNDGSPDDSLARARALQQATPELVVVDLSRNFGHHHAMQAGLRVARGQRVFLIDCDLEVSPGALVDFCQRQDATGADLVYGYQEARKGGWFERFSGGLFWRLFNRLSDTQVPENLLTERVMSRRYVEALLSLGDHNIFLGGMMSWTGFDQIGLPIPKRQRDGRTTYSLIKRVQLMVNAVSSFSSRPLSFMFNGGVAITFASFAYVAYLVVRKLAFGDTLIGFTSVMAMLALTLGVLTTGLGLIGIYLGKVFNQVRGRPNYIIRDIHRGSGLTFASTTRSEHVALSGSREPGS